MNDLHHCLGDPLNDTRAIVSLNISGDACEQYGASQYLDIDPYGQKCNDAWIGGNVYV